ncbi:MAG: lipopolysaccharide heptosyltransferase I [Betaproteobacteria bacterium]
MNCNRPWRLRYNQAMRVLLVKLSSLGDVIHNLPVVSDLARVRPDWVIDWAIETPYAEIATLHPAVGTVLPVPLRQLKKHWWSAAAWRDVRASRACLSGQHYDRILDTQGLLKSAWVSRWTGGPVTGFSATSAREPLAARFYDQRVDVPRELHAVTRNRLLAGQAFGYTPPATVDYGLVPPARPLPWLPATPFVVLLHATSRANKTWPDSSWIKLGQRLQASGLNILLPWGNELEHATSRRIAQSLPGATVPPRMTLTDAAVALARAAVVIGVDTGLAHLAVALGRPTIGLYVTTQPRLTGLFGGAQDDQSAGDHAVNLGGGSESAPAPPDVDTVWGALQPHLNPASTG